MKYYLIAGEASGDLHASHLMAQLRRIDAQAEFRAVGGDMMQAEGATLLMHYRHLAYMGLLPVLTHLPTILKGMRNCRRDILEWQPDVLILVDYPGFNLQMASYVHLHSSIPVYYYISPKIWAWKTFRIRSIKKHVSHLFCILPFEVDYFWKKHRYKVHYVGNPTADEVYQYLESHPHDPEAFRQRNGLDSRPLIALLAGSRRQEIRANLPRMIQAVKPYADRYQAVVAAAPGVEDAYYQHLLRDADLEVSLLKDQTYPLLQHSTAALVTSGTATLETALFGVPQVVCYYMSAGRLASFGRKFLRVPYISLVNLVANAPVVPELVAHQMTVERVRRHLGAILPGGTARETQLDGILRMKQLLGPAGCPEHAAALMWRLLRGEKPESDGSL